MKKYYKVVSSTDSGYYSCRVGGFDINFKILYKINEYVKPKNGSKLFCFDNLTDAQKFRSMRENIFEVNVINPSTKMNHLFCRNIFKWQCYKKAFKLRGNHKKFRHLLKGFSYVPPKGTVLCDAIKLIRKVI